MKTYHRKRGLLNFNWEWQFHELKELLSSVVTASILGQRNLILCVDALDECDLIGAKSVIQFFEHLASSSILEGTKFNVCLSSRYWPQFTIRHCFKTRVELENHGDITSYIQQQLETMQSVANDNNKLAVLKTKLQNKANGSFLWVVLVVQELLTAHDNGATLGEIDRILHRVSPDLWNFYQHQMENTKYDDRLQMLSMLQCVFYSLRPLSPTELRYTLAFGHENFSSYSEWEQSSEHVISNAQMEKRIREKSKGLIEIVELPEEYNAFKALTERRPIVQFIHQSVRDFLSRDGFESLRRCELPNDAASGHEFIKIACFNYLNTTDIKNVPKIDFRFYSNIGVRRKMPTLSEDHPLLEYAVDHLFPHAALAEGHGIQQDGLRSHLSDNIQGSFERWKYLNDLVHIQRDDRKPSHRNPYNRTLDREIQGPEARPLHLFAQYGLLPPGLRKLDENPNIRGGLYDYPLLAAAAGGYTDVVRCLLNSGADLQISSPLGETAYHWAAILGHVDVLKLLLEHPLSVITLQQRIDVAKRVQECSVEYGSHNTVSARQVHEIQALLISEDYIPVSAIDGIIDIIDDDDYEQLLFTHVEPLLALILDKCEAEAFRNERLWYYCVATEYVGVSLIQRLLDGVESIDISEDLLVALSHRERCIEREEDADTAAMILLERGNVEITENFVDNLCRLTNSAQLLRQLAAAGMEIPPITWCQTKSALSFGSPESVGWFVQHAPDDASSDKMLHAAVQNPRFGAQVVRVLLGLRSIDTVCEATVIRSLRNKISSFSLLKTFEDRWGTLVFSMDALVTAISECHLYVVKFVLSRCERFSLTESLFITAFTRITAMRGTPYHRVGDIVDLLLEYDPAFHVQDRLVAETVAMCHCQEILESYLRHGKALVLTENVVRAAARNLDHGVDALETIFQHNSGAKVSDTMVLEALRSRCGAALITLMLENDPSIAMQEDFLIAAASNPDEGALVLEALHEKDRITLPGSIVRTTRAPPAKRQRLSSDLSPSLRDRGSKSAQITTRVIEAAASNNNKYQRRRLLSLFQTWGVLTEGDRKLFHSSDELSSCSSSDELSSYSSS